MFLQPVIELLFKAGNRAWQERGNSEGAWGCECPMVVLRKADPSPTGWLKSTAAAGTLEAGPGCCSCMSRHARATGSSPGSVM